MVNALAKKSPYLESFNGEVTYIKNPAKNYVAAVKEALGRNPEGVCLYFKRGSEAHMIVAIGYKGDTIYYSDPGRVESKGNIVDFSQTWVYHEHKMTYKNIAYMAALDVK
jgi:predicted double-glycine peptidase